MLTIGSITFLLSDAHAPSWSETLLSYCDDGFQCIESLLKQLTLLGKRHRLVHGGAKAEKLSYLQQFAQSGCLDPTFRAGCFIFSFRIDRSSLQ
jgi:hypothetical protein